MFSNNSSTGTASKPLPQITADYWHSPNNGTSDDDRTFVHSFASAGGRHNIRDETALRDVIIGTFQVAPGDQYYGPTSRVAFQKSGLESECPEEPIVYVQHTKGAEAETACLKRGQTDKTWLYTGCADSGPPVTGKGSTRDPREMFAFAPEDYTKDGKISVQALAARSMELDGFSDWQAV